MPHYVLCLDFHCHLVREIPANLEIPYPDNPWSFIFFGICRKFPNFFVTSGYIRERARRDSETQGPCLRE